MNNSTVITAKGPLCDEHRVHYATILMEFIVGLPGLMLYVLVLATIWSHRQEDFKNPFYSLLILLGLPDLLLGLYMTFYRQAVFIFRDSITGGYFDMIVASLTLLVGHFSAVVHAVIAWTRFVAIVQFQSYANRITKKRLLIVITVAEAPTVFAWFVMVMVGKWVIHPCYIIQVPSVTRFGQAYNLAYLIHIYWFTFYDFLLTLAIFLIYSVVLTAGLIRFTKTRRTNNEAAASIKRELKLVIQALLPFVVIVVYTPAMWFGKELISSGAVLIYVYSNPLIYLLLDRRLRNHVSKAVSRHLNLSVHPSTTGDRSTTFGGGRGGGHTKETGASKK